MYGIYAVAVVVVFNGGGGGRGGGRGMLFFFVLVRWIGVCLGKRVLWVKSFGLSLLGCMAWMAMVLTGGFASG